MCILFKNLFTANAVFHANGYLDARAFYLHTFNRVPAITYVAGLEINRAADFVEKRLSAEIKQVFKVSEWMDNEKGVQYHLAVLVLKGRRMIEIGSENIVLYHGSGDYAWAYELIHALGQCKPAEKKSTIGFAQPVAMN